MKIIKKFSKRDDKSELISRIFENTIKRLELPFDSITLSLDDKSRVDLKDNNAYICLDYDNQFLHSKDKKAVTLLILQLIQHALIKKSINAPYFIETIIVNRKMISKGLEDNLFYLFYISMTTRKKEIETIKEFLEINIPWLSFYNSYNSRFMKKMIASFKYRKIFEKLTKNLFSATKKDLMDEKNLKNATKTYNELIKRGL